MKLVTFIIFLGIFIPGIVYGFVASDFIVNRQSTYAVPRNVSNVLILDLTLPEPLQSIKINNAGTAQQGDISKISVFEDGPSPGWDGDESARIIKSSAPFWDTELMGDFSQKRIFVTVDISLTAVSGRTIKPEALIDDVAIVGFERMILQGVSTPSVPITPLAKTPEALSASSIRWHFMDLSNNEFGFKILDGNLKEVARSETADIAYLDETGLKPDTEYSGRQVIAFNDRGESPGSLLTIFPAVRTLKEENIVPVKESVPASNLEPSAAAPPTLSETIQTKIADIQRQINDLLKQINELVKQSSAIVFGALLGFLRAFFAK